MKTEHRIHFSDAKKMSTLSSESVHLVVTSPPYPMIEMWDTLFRKYREIDKALRRPHGREAFEAMHRRLEPVWDELYRILVPGGIICINIGDATRTVDDEFALYSNHSRILSYMLGLGFRNLPNILWRKQTNAPNKFMGSGMMPPGAYVTLEHEYILIFRKGDKRLFKSTEEKSIRRQSAFFWEERNQWFSDVWMDLKGTRQKTGDRKLRMRSGAFPFELAYRLICMFSVMGDTVVDPFLGTGTTLAAAVATGRNSVGYELDDSFAELIRQRCHEAVQEGRLRIAERLDEHSAFVREREVAGKTIKHENRVYGFPVVTRQETELTFYLPQAIEAYAENRFRVTYEHPGSPSIEDASRKTKKTPVGKKGQLQLFN